MCIRDSCKTGKYRPTEDSKMRNLGRPWHAVNEQVAYERFALYTRNLSLIHI